ncbi:MAG TPA: hypothetical protein VNV25_25730 [Gemmatimonadaceae bacterium]|nr:hypothetical protein [Gemmatimonadaceae bacterium]
MKITVFAMLSTLCACGGTAFSALDQGAPDADRPDSGGAESAASDAGSGSETTPPDDAGNQEADAPGCTCVTDLSGIGLADFSIAFDIEGVPSSSGPMALLNQRSSACGFAVPYWDLLVPNNAGQVGEIRLTIGNGNGTSYIDDVYTTARVDDGAKHHVLVSRSDAGTAFQLAVDGVGAVQPGGLPESMGTMAPLQVGIEPGCSYAPLQGQITNVCMAVGCALH